MDDTLAMRDLLVRVDQKVSDIHVKLDAMERRADGLDKRLTALEQEAIQRKAALADYDAVKARLLTIEKERAAEKGFLAGGRWVVGLVSGAIASITTLAVKFVPLMFAAT